MVPVNCCCAATQPQQLPHTPLCCLMPVCAGTPGTPGAELNGTASTPFHPNVQASAGRMFLCTPCHLSMHALPGSASTRFRFMLHSTCFWQTAVRKVIQLASRTGSACQPACPGLKPPACLLSPPVCRRSRPRRWTLCASTSTQVRLLNRTCWRGWAGVNKSRILTACCCWVPSVAMLQLCHRWAVTLQVTPARWRSAWPPMPISACRLCPLL